MRTFATQVFAIWYAERPSQLAAALAYYAMFALAPIILIAFGVAGFFIDSLEVANRISERAAAILGPQAVEAIQNLVAAQSRPGTQGSLLASIIGALALLYAASGLFLQLKYVLNRIWRIPYSPVGATRRLIRAQLISFLLVIAVGLLIVVLALLNIAVAWLGELLQRLLGIPDATLLIALLLTVGLLALSFSLLYTVLPDVRIRWRDSLPGALIAAVLTVLAGVVIGLVLQLTSAASALAAAGSVAFLMVGINYLAQIFLFGAVVTRAFCSHYGATPPDPNIEPPKEEAREPTNPQSG